jgi:hypothetical protein
MAAAKNRSEVNACSAGWRESADGEKVIEVIYGSVGACRANVRWVINLPRTGREIGESFFLLQDCISWPLPPVVSLRLFYNGRRRSGRC